MNLISNLSIMVIPRWVKAIVSLIVVALTVAYIAIAILGATDDTKPGWIEASAYLLGILLPFMFLALILGFRESGVDALVARSARYLSQTIPSLAVALQEPAQQFHVYGGGYKPRDARRPRVRVQSAANMTVANYVVEAYPQSDFVNGEPACARKLAFRIELNATKANINILVEKSLLPGDYKTLDPADLFPNSVSGAKHEGYWLNEHLLEREIAGTSYIAIVVVKRLSEEFLTNPVLQLDFGQDLMLMLRAILDENTKLFAKVDNSE